MKKVIALTSILALAACSSGISQEEIAKHDADFAQWNCERIATSNRHLVYKCPTSKHLSNIRKEQPNGDLSTYDGQENLIVETSKDESVTMIEVVLGDSGNCKENFHYRTVIRPIDYQTKEPYAFFGCR